MCELHLLQGALRSPSQQPGVTPGPKQCVFETLHLHTHTHTRTEVGGSAELAGHSAEWSADLYLEVPVGQQGGALLLAQAGDVAHQAVVVVSQLLHLLAQTLALLPQLLHALAQLPQLPLPQLLLPRPRLLQDIQSAGGVA